MKTNPSGAERLHLCSLVSHDPRLHRRGEWRPVEWASPLRAAPDRFESLLAAAAIILVAQGRPGLYLRLVSPRGEVLAEFNPNQTPHQTPRP